MKKISLIALSALIVAGSAFAASPKTISCAVMLKNKVDIAKATAGHMYADYKGRRYYFCCGGCPEEFAKDPAKFAKSPSTKIPKAPKAPKPSA